MHIVTFYRVQLIFYVGPVLVIKPGRCFVLPFLVPGPCDPEDLLDGVVFGAKYLGSTQIKSDKNPSTNARMAQAQEAVDRIKVKMSDMSVC